MLMLSDLRFRVRFGGFALRPLPSLAGYFCLLLGVWLSVAGAFAASDFTLAVFCVGWVADGLKGGEGVINKGEGVVKKGVDAVKDLVPFLK